MKAFAAALLALALLSACQYSQTGLKLNASQNASLNETSAATTPLPEEVVEGVDRGVPPAETDYSVVVTGVEGELIKLEPEAIDPDGDAVTFEFSEPFNEYGEWQTRKGDAGDYLVTVKAFDGTDYSSVKVLVKVLRANQKPILNCPSKVTVKEGELLRIGCEAVDPDGDEVVVSYRGFTNSSVKRIEFDEEGEHLVLVTAWDKANVEEKVYRNVTVEVLNVNRPPQVSFDFGSKLEVEEGELVVVKPVIKDPDNDPYTVTYTPPFNQEGEWQTKIGDYGSYNASVIVTDGENTVRKDFAVVVRKVNTPPVLEVGEDVSVEEGDLVKLDVKASDRESGNVTVTISGFMNSEEYLTTYEDAYPEGCSYKGCVARYEVVITASDGELNTSKTIYVYVKDKNRPPVFKVPA